MLVDLLQQRRVVGTGLPVLFEFIGGSWHFCLKTIADFSLRGICHRGEKIASGLTLRAKPTHIHKISLSLPSRTIENLTSLVQHNDLVKLVVNVLRCLVDCNGVTGADEISAGP